jgi:hypothetical protein
MDSGSPVGRLAAHETPEVLRLDGRSLRLGRTLRILWRILREHQPNRKPLAKGAPLWLWAVAILDIVAVASMIAAGDWLDKTSTLTSIVTLGGHHGLILIMAVAGFAMLAGLAPLTRAFSRATDLEEVLLGLACVFSVVALAGALFAILLLALVCALAVVVLVALIALLVVLVR